MHVKLLQGKLETDLHITLTDRHQYLHYSSSHPRHTKQSTVHSQTLSRVSRVCSHEANFRKHAKEMKSWFLKRTYPNDVIEKEMKKVKFSKISSTRKDNTKGVSTKLSTKIYIFFIWMKKLRKYLHRSPGFLSLVLGN